MISFAEFDGTTVLCRVCGDKASGFHYGVHSCEGCKVSHLFFLLSVLRSRIKPQTPGSEPTEALDAVLFTNLNNSLALQSAWVAAVER